MKFISYLLLLFVAHSALAADEPVPPVTPAAECAEVTITEIALSTRQLDARVVVSAPEYERGSIMFTYTLATDGSLSSFKRLWGNSSPTASSAVQKLVTCRRLPSVPQDAKPTSQPIVTLRYTAGPGELPVEWTKPKADTCGSPAYPPSELKNAIEATVYVRVLTSELGDVIQHEAFAFPDLGEFKAAAIAAAATCRFVPAKLRSGAAVRSYTTLEMKFKAN